MIVCLKPTWKMFLCILLTRLSRVSQRSTTMRSCGAYLSRLADLLANHLPLVVLILFDRIQQGLALHFLLSGCNEQIIAGISYLVLRKLGIVHVLSACQGLYQTSVANSLVPCTNASSLNLRFS